MVCEQGTCLWEQPEPTGDTPGGRSGHTLNVLGNPRKGFVFGGCADRDGEPVYLNDLYAMDLSGDQPKWSKCDPEGKAPPARWRHTSTTISNTQMLVFGGISDGSRLNDCHILDAEGETPSWQDVAPGGVAPSPRSYHTATLLGDKLYIVGGYGGHGQRRQYFNDVHILDLKENTWVGEEQGVSVEREGGLKIEGTPPAPRGNHSTSVVEFTFLCVMGGRDTSSYFDDTHILCTETLTWTQIRTHPNPAAPTRICSHMAEGIPSVPSYMLFCFGGQTVAEKDRTAWSYRNKAPARPPPPPSARSSLRDGGPRASRHRTGRPLAVAPAGAGSVPPCDCSRRLAPPPLRLMCLTARR